MSELEELVMYLGMIVIMVASRKKLYSLKSAFQQHLLLKPDVSELKLSSDSTYLPQTATEYSIVLYARSEMLKSMFWVLHKPLNPQKLGILRRFLSGVR